jgi:peptide/nickel transport system substrate-binding protein
MRLLTALLGVVLLVSPASAAVKTLRIGLEAYPIRFDPRLATDVASGRLSQLIFNGLVGRDQAFAPVPELASSWENPKPTEYLFHLKPGVTFHDGSPCTAADVVFTYRTILDESFGSPKKGSFEVITKVEAVDPLTVRFTLREPFAPFLPNVAVQAIVPAKAAADPKRFAANPVGTGPFRFVSAETDHQVTLAAFDRYHGGRPKLDGIVLLAIPEENTRVFALQKGDVDLVQNAIPPTLLPTFEKDKRYRVVRRAGSNMSYLGLNLKDPILGKLPVRKALAHATDTKSIIDHLLGGLATPATGLLSPDSWAYEGKVATYPLDRAKAARLLDEAGYRDPDGSGPKTRFSLLYKTSQAELGRRIGEVLQDQWSKVGVGLTIRSFEWGTFYSDIRSGNFQLFRLEWVGVSDPDHFHYVLNSGMIPPEGANRGFFVNAEIDRLTLDGRRTLDAAKRKEIYSKVQKIAAEELPSIPLWYPANVVVARRELTGFTPYPAGDLTSLAAADWVGAR